MFTRVISQSKVEIQQALLEEIGKYSHTVYHTGNKVNEIVTQTTLTSLGRPGNNWENGNKIPRNTYRYILGLLRFILKIFLPTLHSFTRLPHFKETE